MGILGCTNYRFGKNEGSVVPNFLFSGLLDPIIDIRIYLIGFSMMFNAKWSKLNLSDEQLLEIPMEKFNAVYWYHNVGWTAMHMTGFIMHFGR